MKNANSVRGYAALTLMAAAMLRSSAQFVSGEVIFDQGVDVRSFIKEAAASEVKAPDAAMAPV